MPTVCSLAKQSVNGGVNEAVKNRLRANEQVVLTSLPSAIEAAVHTQASRHCTMLLKSTPVRQKLFSLFD